MEQLGGRDNSEGLGTYSARVNSHLVIYLVVSLVIHVGASLRIHESMSNFAPFPSDMDLHSRLCYSPLPITYV